jgi:hypothetical protein
MQPSSAWPLLKVDGTRAALFYPDVSDAVELDGTLANGQLDVKSQPNSSIQPCPAGPATYQFKWSAAGTFGDQNLDVNLTYRIERSDGTLGLQETYHLHGRLLEQPPAPQVSTEARRPPRGD